MPAEIVVRRAESADAAGVVALCRSLDPRNFQIDAWAAWCRDPDSLQFVATENGQVVGALQAAVRADGTVFSQGLRVAATHWRRAVARRLLELQRQTLAARGARVLRGITGLDNAAARALFAATGWREVSAVARRELAAWRGTLEPLCAAPSARAALARALARHRLWLSHAGLAHFRRVLDADAADRLDELLSARRLVGGGAAAGVVDPPAGADRWIASLAGEPAAVVALVERAAAPAGERRSRLTVDAPADAAVQAALDRLGFAPPGPLDRYVVVECPLTTPPVAPC